MLKICGEKKPLSNYSFKLGVMNTLKVRQYRQTIPVRWLKFYSFIKLKRDKKNVRSIIIRIKTYDNRLNLGKSYMKLIFLTYGL